MRLSPERIPDGTADTDETRLLPQPQPWQSNAHSFPGTWAPDKWAGNRRGWFERR